MAIEYIPVLTQEMKDTFRSIYGLQIRNDECDVVGIAQPMGEVIDHTTTALVIKVKGHSYWSARGESAYAPAEYQIYDLRNAEIYTDSNGTIHYRKAVITTSFPVRKQKTS